MYTCSAGLYVGYFSAGAYLKSRVSQLLKNRSRGDADGLSISMFLCAICGNVFGALGILVRLDSVTQVVWQLPWLVGMLGTVMMDVLLALQARQAEQRHGHATAASPPASPTDQALLAS